MLMVLFSYTHLPPREQGPVTIKEMGLQVTRETFLPSVGWPSVVLSVVKVSCTVQWQTISEVNFSCEQFRLFPVVDTKPSTHPHRHTYTLVCVSQDYDNGFGREVSWCQCVRLLKISISLGPQWVSWGGQHWSCFVRAPPIHQTGPETSICRRGLVVPGPTWESRDSETKIEPVMKTLEKERNKSLMDTQRWKSVCLS